MGTHISTASFDMVAYDHHIEDLRTREYASLKATTYLDHAGTTLYARSLLDAFHADMTTHLFGNPHSISPASNLSTIRVDKARQAVLKYFNAAPQHFDVVFTSSATAAVKLVADCFRDQTFLYGYHKDCHSSIVGVRELAESSQCLQTIEDVAIWSDRPNDTRLRLFAYPAQSNMTGYRPPLTWSAEVRGHSKNAYVLLDAASYLTSARLDLSDEESSPDFIALSFYKIFGFPTGLGALIVRKASSSILEHRRYFGGGTVDQVTVIGAQTHAIKETSLHDRLEDGTLPFHLIAALTFAIDIQAQLFISAKHISLHMAELSRWLYDALDRLRHKSGCRVIEIYKDSKAIYGDPSTQGPIIAFSVLKADGSYVGKSHFERLANECGFQIRTGGVCNPGGIASMLKLQHWELQRNFAEGVRCGDDIDVMGSKPTGIVRVSLGPMSTMSDVQRFVQFVKEYFIDRSAGPATVRQPQASIVKPVVGCVGFSVKLEEYAAYETWNEQWCLVSNESNQILPEALSQIDVQIDVQAGTLIFNNEHRVSLWDLPRALEQQTVGANGGRKWDVYNDPINAWLSEKIGSPCSLARFRAINI